MKILRSLATFTLLLAGCANQSGQPVMSQGGTSPAGTNVGTSNPGINQSTTNTTATRADDGGANRPNGIR